MSYSSSTATLASWDPMELFSLMNRDKLAITCVGYAPSCRRRCRNAIAAHNISAAKAVMSQLMLSGVSDDEMKELLFQLAEYTLCRAYHQRQATEVSGGWWRVLQRHLEDEERFSDTSDDGDDFGDSDGDSDSDSSTGSTSDHEPDESDNHDDTEHADAELRRRLSELETWQHEFDELLQRQRRQLLRGTGNGLLSAPLASANQRLPTREASLAEQDVRQRIYDQDAAREAEQLRQEEAHQRAQRERAAARERSRRGRVQAEEARREEARRQAEREQAEREAEAEAEAEAEVEAERLRQETAEQARQERERERERQQQALPQIWESAWLRYETAWEKLSGAGSLTVTDVRKSSIWPTKTGSWSSCSEDNVKLFFACQPGSVSRSVIRRQALRWHPDRAARLFGNVKDEGQARELTKAVTMISQVVIEIMGVASR